MNSMDLLGKLMGGMSRSGGRRIENSMGSAGLGAPGGILGQLLGQAGAGGGSGGLMDALGKMAGSLSQGGGGSAVPSGMAAGGAGGLLGSLAGALLGGGQGSAPSGANAGSGGMAVLGGLALEALRRMGGGGAAAPSAQPDDATRLVAGLRQPANADEERQLMDVADLTVKAMINAAKADGRIDEAETERIVGKLREDGISEEEQRFVAAEMAKPIDLDSIARAVPNRQVATQIYAASLLAIEVDTEQEKRYLQELAARLELDNNAVGYLHSALGIG